MKELKSLAVLFVMLISVVLIMSCAQRPRPGRIIDCIDQGVTLTLVNGWEGETIDTDWRAYKRILKGREDFMWVFPPITARDIPVAEVEDRSGYMKWRFKGVEGTFDPNISPTSRDFPVPPGLWSMDPTKLEVLGSNRVILEWPGVQGTEATARIYEVIRGTGDTMAIRRTYVVTFNYGENAYEFVMFIPNPNFERDYIEAFWSSIEDVQIGIEE